MARGGGSTHRVPRLLRMCEQANVGAAAASPCLAGRARWSGADTGFSFAYHNEMPRRILLKTAPLAYYSGVSFCLCCHFRAWTGPPELGSETTKKRCPNRIARCSRAIQKRKTDESTEKLQRNRRAFSRGREYLPCPAALERWRCSAAGGGGGGGGVFVQQQGRRVADDEHRMSVKYILAWSPNFTLGKLQKYKKRKHLGDIVRVCDCDIVTVVRGAAVPTHGR
jgi:hypothetical protein